MKAIDRFMSLLGYVPRPAKYADSLLSLKIDIDSASVDSALAKVERLSAAAEQAEIAVLHAGIIAPPAAQFAATELAADPARGELLDQMRALIEEIRQERRNRFVVRGKLDTYFPAESPATGAAASGLPG